MKSALSNLLFPILLIAIVFFGDNMDGAIAAVGTGGALPPQNCGQEDSEIETGSLSYFVKKYPNQWKTQFELSSSLLSSWNGEVFWQYGNGEPWRMFSLARDYGFGERQTNKYNKAKQAHSEAITQRDRLYAEADAETDRANAQKLRLRAVNMQIPDDPDEIIHKWKKLKSWTEIIIKNSYDLAQSGQPVLASDSTRSQGSMSMLARQWLGLLHDTAEVFPYPGPYPGDAVTHGELKRQYGENELKKKNMTGPDNDAITPHYKLTKNPCDPTSLIPRFPFMWAKEFWTSNPRYKGTNLELTEKQREASIQIIPEGNSDDRSDQLELPTDPVDKVAGDQSESANSESTSQSLLQRSGAAFKQQVSNTLVGQLQSVTAEEKVPESIFPGAHKKYQLKVTTKTEVGQKLEAIFPEPVFYQVESQSYVGVVKKNTITWDIARSETIDFSLKFSNFIPLDLAEFTFTTKLYDSSGALVDEDRYKGDLVSLNSDDTQMQDTNSQSSLFPTAHAQNADDSSNKPKQQKIVLEKVYKQKESSDEVAEYPVLTLFPEFFAQYRLEYTPERSGRSDSTNFAYIYAQLSKSVQSVMQVPKGVSQLNNPYEYIYEEAKHSLKWTVPVKDFKQGQKIDLRFLVRLNSSIDPKVREIGNRPVAIFPDGPIKYEGDMFHEELWDLARFQLIVDPLGITDSRLKQSSIELGDVLVYQVDPDTDKILEHESLFYYPSADAKIIPKKILERLDDSYPDSLNNQVNYGANIDRNKIAFNVTDEDGKISLKVLRAKLTADGKIKTRILLANNPDTNLATMVAGTFTGSDFYKDPGTKAIEINQDLDFVGTLQANGQKVKLEADSDLAPRASSYAIIGKSRRILETTWGQKQTINNSVRIVFSIPTAMAPPGIYVPANNRLAFADGHNRLFILLHEFGHWVDDQLRGWDVEEDANNRDHGGYPNAESTYGTIEAMGDFIYHAVTAELFGSYTSIFTHTTTGNIPFDFSWSVPIWWPYNQLGNGDNNNGQPAITIPSVIVEELMILGVFLDLTNNPAKTVPVNKVAWINFVNKSDTSDLPSYGIKNWLACSGAHISMTDFLTMLKDNAPKTLRDIYQILSKSYQPQVGGCVDQTFVLHGVFNDEKTADWKLDVDGTKDIFYPLEPLGYSGNGRSFATDDARLRLVPPRITPARNSPTPSPEVETMQLNLSQDSQKVKVHIDPGFGPELTPPLEYETELNNGDTIPIFPMIEPNAVSVITAEGSNNAVIVPGGESYTNYLTSLASEGATEDSRLMGGITFTQGPTPDINTIVSAYQQARSSGGDLGSAPVCTVSGDTVDCHQYPEQGSYTSPSLSITPTPNTTLEWDTITIEGETLPSDTTIDYQYSTEADNYQAWKKFDDSANWVDLSSPVTITVAGGTRTISGLDNVKDLEDGKTFKVRMILSASKDREASPSFSGFKVTYKLISTIIPPSSVLTFEVSSSSETAPAEATIKINGTIPTDGVTVDFGDGSDSLATKESTLKHTYTKPGTHTIRLVYFDGTATQTATNEIRVKESVTVPDANLSPSSPSTPSSYLPFCTADQGVGTRDINGDGIADLLAYNPLTGQTRLDFFSQYEGKYYPINQWDTMWNTQNWELGYCHYLGKFNTDKWSDKLSYRPSDGTIAMMEVYNDQGYMRTAWTDQWNPWTHLIIGNYNGEGGEDVLSYDPATGKTQLYLANPEPVNYCTNCTSTNTATVVRDGVTTTLTKQATTLSLTPNLQLISGDFNGDTKADLITYNPTNGEATLYQADTSSLGFLPSSNTSIASNPSGASFVSSVYAAGITTVEFNKVWTNTWDKARKLYPGDFTNDSKVDLFSYNPDTGETDLFRATSNNDFSNTHDHTFPASGDRAWSKNWRLITGNFNGKDQLDAIFYNPSSGEAHLDLFHDKYPYRSKDNPNPQDTSNGLYKNTPAIEIMWKQEWAKDWHLNR